MAAIHARSDAATDRFLASTFGRIDLSEPKADASRYDLHLLKLEYPACNLLPPNTLPNLAPPTNLMRRDTPPLDKQSIGITEATFLVAFPKKPRAVSPVLPTYNHLALLGAVDDLSSGAGESKLKVVCYYSGRLCNTIYRIKLTKSYKHVRGTSEMNFDLTSGQWKLLLGFEDSYGWIRTLQNIVTRESYRAVYHVRERLVEHFGEEIAASEEEAWPTAWASSIAPSVANAEDAAADRAMASAREYANAYQTWLTLDCEEPESRKRTEVHAMTVFRALHAAIGSLSPPELITPNNFNHATHQHTRLVLEDFESLLYGADFSYKLTAEQLLTNLLAQAMETRVDGESKLVLSDITRLPGWDAFLQTWFTRAVNFVVRRRCNDASHGHVGIHQHGRELLYNPELWESEAAAMSSQDQEEEGDDQSPSYEPPATVRDLERMMRDTGMK
ncbi:hypothetical protein LTR36_000742 [Oleoguttula mirabilis]|uniref:Uncharacterized protein n=1 Tax=Oleoguttula mirabilis TaxID=1507867 RepID=A0AAV9JQA6_9PEZI|nr:hypothetical protein LTR36_000742 [Oleoguttula mirabilis]